MAALQVPFVLSQIRARWERSGLTLAQLARMAGLDCSDKSLSRKLAGHPDQALRLHEAAALVRVLFKRGELGVKRKRAA